MFTATICQRKKALTVGRENLRASITSFESGIKTYFRNDEEKLINRTMTLLAISTRFILFISSAGVVQGIGLASLLYFHPQSDKSVTKFLSLHIITISILMFAGLSEYLFSWQTLILHLSFQFLIGPFL